MIISSVKNKEIRKRGLFAKAGESHGRINGYLRIDPQNFVSIKTPEENFYTRR